MFRKDVITSKTHNVMQQGNGVPAINTVFPSKILMQSLFNRYITQMVICYKCPNTLQELLSSRRKLSV